ncbi:hypothetical protein O181_111389 [Austropuccinia psidii MF-1]|uniref:Uncharacterized protein n=1 Tax=Austropuccinia psidii MF-1 TaxID=1389203 RepID=A0A9Q3K1W2_9BASI|nr:hypothetical protein [Austropuccinia psidii MF-1]
MVTIGPSSNVLLPSPSFIGRIVTALRSGSQVTIGWWPRRGVEKSILEGTGQIIQNCLRRPSWGPTVHSRSDMASSLSTTKESSQGCLGRELLWPCGWKGRTTKKHFLCACGQESQPSVVVEE